MTKSIIQLNNGIILKGEFCEWNQYGIVMKNINELKYEQSNVGMKENEQPSIYPKDVHVCFDRHFIISEYSVEA